MYTYTYIHTCILGVGAGVLLYYTTHTVLCSILHTQQHTHYTYYTTHYVHTYMLCSTHTTLYTYTIHTLYYTYMQQYTHYTSRQRGRQYTHSSSTVGRQAGKGQAAAQPASHAGAQLHTHVHVYIHTHTYTTLCVYTYIHTYNVLYYTHTCIHYYYTILYQQVGSTMYLGHHVLYCATQGRARMWQALSYCNRGFWQKALRKVVKKITKKFSLNPLTRCAQCGILRVPRDRESLRAQAHTHVEAKQRAQLVKHLTKTRSLLCKGVESV